MHLQRILTGAIDAHCGGNVTVTSEQETIHRGYYFSTYNYNTAVIDTGTINLQINSNSTRQIHLKFIEVYSVGSPFLVEILANCTTSGGTIISAYNRNLDSSITSDTVIRKDVTVSAGTTVDAFLSGGGTGIGHTGTSSIGSLPIEWVMSADSKTVVRVTNSSGGAAPVGIRVSWGEASI